MNLNIFYTTCGKNSEAKKLAKKILKDNFANCINIIKNVESFYKDSSKINNSVEVILIIKTIKQFEDMKLYLEDNRHYLC